MFLLGLVFAVVGFVGHWVGIIAFVTFLLHTAVQYFCAQFPQNLKQRYGAEWGLVTGGSSGIGKAIAEKLAQQGVNVVLVALDDPLLHTTFDELSRRFPARSFRKVGVNLGSVGAYMERIVEATEDIDVTLVFNNAGYIYPGFFADSDYERLRNNFECNAGCSIGITHHFVRKMISQKKRGFIGFTSSAAAYLAGPTATLYSPTKAFLTNFAVTLSSEVRDAGIDVTVIHPSPVASNFYKTTGPKLGTLASAQQGAVPPSVIANELFASAGRLTVWNQGLVSHIFRTMTMLLDFSFLSEAVVRFGWLNADHKNLVAQSKLRNSSAKK